MYIEEKVLSLASAIKMADAAEKLAVEKNIRIVIAIMDAHGNLKYFRRMDKSNFVAVRMSQLKAMTSASMPVSTKTVGERSKAMEVGSYLNSALAIYAARTS